MKYPVNNNQVNNVSDRDQGLNSLKGHEHKRFSNDYYYSQLVQTAARYYDQMDGWRKKWTRANNYFMGRQLDDKVVYDGMEITVSQLLKIRGLPEFQNDIISDKVLTLKGLLRQESMAATCRSTDSDEDMYAALFSEFLRKNDNLNERQELNAEMFQAACVYGFLAAKVSYTEREGKEDVYIDNVNIYNLAVPPYEKNDLSDIEFIAEAHDMTWQALLRTFCEKTGDEAELRNIYAREAEHLQSLRKTGFNRNNDSDGFYHPSVIGKYRVIEIWKKERNRALWCHDRGIGEAGFRPLADKEAIEAENARRMADNIMKDELGLPVVDELGNTMHYVAPDELGLIEYTERIEEFWYYRFISPNGYLLKEGISPHKVQRDGYSFRFHPYVFMVYGMDGESRSFVDRTIDKQNATNHYMLLFDSIMGNAAKGAIAYDVAGTTERQSIDEALRQYNKPDGVVFYDSRKGEAPHALQNVNVPAGLEWMVSKNEQMLVGQSGVQGALQGVHRNTSGRQYAMERQSASTTVADYFGTFYSFCLRVSKKQLWLIQQYYDSTRSVKISGMDYKQYFNPETMSDINTDIELDMDAYSALMRQANNDMLWQLMLQNRIDIITMLDCGSWTNTARLKQRIQEFQEQQAAIAQAGGMPALPDNSGGASAGPGPSAQQREEAMPGPMTGVTHG